MRGVWVAGLAFYPVPTMFMLKPKLLILARASNFPPIDFLLRFLDRKLFFLIVFEKCTPQYAKWRKKLLMAASLSLGK